VEVAFDSGQVIFGRALGAGIELPFPRISGRHARLFREAGGYRVEDLGSSNGTRLGGRSLAPHVSEAVAPGETLLLADVEVRFEGETVGGGPFLEGEGTATFARRLVHDLFEVCPPAEVACLIVLDGPAQGRTLALSAMGRAFKIGRGDGCDLILPDEDVSREHAAFERGDGAIVVRDLESKNGVEVEGMRVAGMRSLHDGDIVRVGETHLRVVDPEDRYLRQMEAADASAHDREPVQEPVADVGQGGGDAAVSPAPDAPGLPGARAAPSPEAPLAPSRLPLIATAIASAVLLIALGLVLALVSVL
jgi:pSer/pThr/pTyr-binding forkhead associated (FHA) protein